MGIVIWIVQILSMLSLICAISKVSLPCKTGFEVILKGTRNGITDPRFRPYFLLMVTLIFMNFIETHFDARITSMIGMDFTPVIKRIDGDSIYRIQDIFPKNLVIISYFSFMYFLMLMTLLFASGFIYLYMEREDLVRMLSFGYSLCYFIALPFYIFFPVNEVWVAEPKRVLLLSNQISPILAEGMRSVSALNNCFPSLHTAFSLLIALIASSSEIRKFAIITWLSAISIIFSTIYLGIHWVTDVVAGIILTAIIFPILLLDRKRSILLIGGRKERCGVR